jgi:alanyl-tRNA synthetase
MMSSSEIRQLFLNFFKEKDHVIVPSSPIVIKDDPTLLFTNAGMNQFKDYFLGNKISSYKRVADTQKCLRVSGKHNDLEEVGVDTYHHTMFEMLGNWSFGDYFKKEAIAWSWELLTAVYKISKDQLYVTVFEGDANENLPKDEEAISFWKECLFAAGFKEAEIEDRIIMGNKKDNFWEMGDTGPCGPCTEIHIDSRTEEERKKVEGKTLVNKDHPQVIEVWNNVFIEYNRKKDGSLEPLPAKHVDTGMGFERLVRIIQKKESNYDTDVFSGTIAGIEKITGLGYEKKSAFHPNTGFFEESIDIAFRVIADHIRAIAFPIADGQLPSNTGAGYVIRRVLRRAVRYYSSNLNYKSPLLYLLVPVLANQYRDVFPELIEQEDFIKKVIREEEESFIRTLDKGLKRLNSIIKSLPDNSESFITGKEAFELMDTYGFPIDLIVLIAKENNLKVDETGFQKEMLEQKSRSRSAADIEIGDWKILGADESCRFRGYNNYQQQTFVSKYREINSKGKDMWQIVLVDTPFYAESGGQIGDIGTIEFLETKQKVTILNTIKENDLIIQITDQKPYNFLGEVVAKIDIDRRKIIQVHHSATHLMHAALRQVLGKHVAQKGSLVNDQHLRFDFSHFTKVTDEEIAKVEAIVNEKIRENIPVITKEMKKDEAVEMGAMALFGEKYGEVVRVVIMDPSYSIELCGGTHVGYTGQLGIFKITNETAVGAGVRRIEAVSGKAAQDYINKQLETVNAIRETLKNPKDLSKAIANLISENTALKKQLEKSEGTYLVSLKNEILQKAEVINNVNFIGQQTEISNAESLRKICFSLKNDLKDFVVVLTAAINGKAHVALMIDDSIASAKNLDAAKIVKEKIAPLIKGGGGGQKNFATAGGQSLNNLISVITTVRQLL